MAHLLGPGKPTGCKECKRRKSASGGTLVVINYKNVRLLQKLSTPQGKLFGRKRSGLCAHCQRRLKRAVKRARFVGLLSYAGQ